MGRPPIGPSDRTGTRLGRRSLPNRKPQRHGRPGRRGDPGEAGSSARGRRSPTSLRPSRRGQGGRGEQPLADTESPPPTTHRPRIRPRSSAYRLRRAKARPGTGALHVKTAGRPRPRSAAGEFEIRSTPLDLEAKGLDGGLGVKLPGDHLGHGSAAHRAGPGSGCEALVVAVAKAGRRRAVRRGDSRTARVERRSDARRRSRHRARQRNKRARRGPASFSRWTAQQDVAGGSKRRSAPVCIQERARPAATRSMGG